MDLNLESALSLINSAEAKHGTNSAIYLGAPKSRRIFLTPTALDLFGLAGDQPEHQWISQFPVLSRIPEPHLSRLLIALYETHVLSTENQIVHPIRIENQGYRWLRLRLYPIRCETTSQELVIGTMEVLPEHSMEVDSEIQLRKRMELVEQIADFGYVETNMVTGEVTATEPVLRLWGFEPGDPSAKERDAWRARVFSEDLERADDNFERDREIGDKHLIEHRIRLPDGKVKWVRAVDSETINELGEPIITAVHIDVTESHKRQQELEESLKRLEDYHRRQTNMFAVISHELRTPVASLRMMLDQQNVEQLEPYGKNISGTLDHLLAVLEDLRSVVRSDDESRPAYHARSPFEVIKNSLAPFLAPLDNAWIKVNFTGDRGSRQTFKLNDQVIRQICTNLIKNTLIHSEASQLDISIAVAELAEGAGQIEIRIQDNGKGIRGLSKAQIFEPFARGETSADGTGLGLYTCVSLAERMGGTFEYLGSPEQGAVFLLRFEAELADEAEESLANNQTEIPSDGVLEGLNILVAEDNPTIQILTGQMLKKAGARATLADNGALALEAMEHQDFDLVLTDIFMPVMDGYALVSALRKADYQRPIIGVTAAVLGDEANKLLDLGASAILPKPMSLGGLERCAADLLFEDQIKHSPPAS